MKRRLVFILFVLGICRVAPAAAQSLSPISSYDDESLREINIPDLLKNLENAMNVISYSGSEALDVKIVKNRMLSDNEQPRVFFNDKVIVESDLTFDAWSNVTKEDVSAKDYLENFNLLYPKKQDPTVSFEIVKVSHLKKTSYYYYNVVFESVFKNKDYNGNPYVPVQRMMEVRLAFDATWNAYINSIRFLPKKFNIDDPKNNFTDFATSFSRTTDFKMQRLAQKREQQRIQQQKINALLIEADKHFLERDYMQAFDLYKQARALDPYNEDVRQKIGTCETALEQDRERKAQEAELKRTVDGLKAVVVKSFQDYEFSIARIVLDSLTIRYQVSNDADLNRIDTRLQSVMPFISRMEIMEQQSEYEDGLDYASRLLRTIKKGDAPVDSLIMAEASYWAGRMYYDIDSSRTDDVTAYLIDALNLSGNKHLPARRLMIQCKLYSKRDKLEAVEMANSMVNTDVSNPDVRALRAMVYAQLRDYDNALKDYQSAIDLKSKDSAVFIQKAQLEFSLGKNIACVLTTTSGLAAFPCNSELYYLRIRAQEESGLYGTAGKDFQKAMSCGFLPRFRDTILAHGKRYFDQGIVFFDARQTDSAFSYFSRSYELCQNLDGLFFRGYSNLLRGKTDQALADLNRVIQLDSTQQHAYYMRGLIKAARGDHESAITDYKQQEKILPDYWKSYAACGRSEMALGMYGKAAESFVMCNTKKYTDSVAAQVVWAYVMAGDYFKAIEMANTYEDDHRSDYAPLFKNRGIAEFRAGRFDKAEEDLLIALEGDSKDVESYLYLSRTYLSMGDQGKARRYANLSRNLCSDCPESMLLSGIAKIAEQLVQGNEEGIELINGAIRKDSSLATPAHLAWIAYGYLLSQRDINRFSSYIQLAKSMDSSDPMVLFVQASVLAESAADRQLSLRSLDQACANGFRYPFLIKGDKHLQACKILPEYRELMDKYFKD